MYKKAYDTTFKHGILQDLQKNVHLKGHLPNFIKNFLLDCELSVRLLNHMSDKYDQQTGVPQGSVISTTPFIIRINNIKIFTSKVHYFLYVDDFVICHSSSNINIIERKLQQIIYKLEQ